MTQQIFTLAIDGHEPEIDPGAWAAPGASLIGRVRLVAGASVWYATVLRGDTEWITIGADTNVQDGCVVHADPGFPTTVGSGVTVGHRAVLHGCTVGDHALIGMGAVLLNGSKVGEGSLVAAGTVLLEGAEVPPGSLVAGTPGKVRRELTDDERAGLRVSAQQYVQNAGRHRDALGG
ncbi:carbonic anhydrase/acetyltransferase-like protein (isoleucine patch superfamily) [Saccharopolyspora erythraea NRRL 2338]|uniref:Carbonic anhydrases/acetyltransferases isoleucine patch superfamily-like protein n=2 Tax=Saccharopolyspora erythraea TaxID=1836 RepID=A4FG35_SACEN|nr:gamma carbonic anhydrase family protein [Saccharopolyspora erythraea]EQD85487.1 anhydrase [Saccharopolyspora erythraea D]PFG96715.1 carbonic anhydrase/acetyltransferase-like protein (isoleucine patch superfamily) [Saccharopolyspora erythraea NRRL 2338]QRK86968.1 gamma carbonic anhydrase family protein [Saccharopolyspora erythraea]CAM03010.1 carbonic anhydrases/acetyltransferases isoleucine patch superfamily-like protein [Saccharopolyspora erythraea NRRL 2338]